MVLGWFWVGGCHGKILPTAASLSDPPRGALFLGPNPTTTIFFGNLPTLESAGGCTFLARSTLTSPPLSLCLRTGKERTGQGRGGLSQVGNFEEKNSFPALHAERKTSSATGGQC